MDKRMLESKRVKDSIALAYFDLLQNKKEELISVTEITLKAKVSRMAYYRNFDSKLDIIEYYINETIWLDMSECVNNGYEWLSKEYSRHFFRIMKKYKNIILLLYEKGYASIILKAFNKANEDWGGDMPANSLERYKLYCAAGASFNVAIEWIKGGCKESVEEIVQSFEYFAKAIIA